MNPLKTFLQTAGYTTAETGGADVRVFLAGLIQAALSLVGIVFFIIMLYGGYMWLSAGGNEEKATKAQQKITGAFIGFIIALMCLMITRFIIGWIGTAVQ